MLITRVTKVTARGNHTLLDEVTMSIHNLEEGTLILQVLIDEREREALIIHAEEEDV